MRNAQLPVSSRPEFVALPSDPRIPLTPAQEKALWGGDVDGMLSQLIQAARSDASFVARLATQAHPTPSTAPRSELAGISQ